MDEDNLDAPEVLETPAVAEETIETPDEEKVELSRSELEDLQRKAAERDDLESKNKQLFERAKKKEAEPRPDGLSNKDVLFLAKADIHEDDIDEVLDWAKFKKVPVAEAYKQIKTTLDVRNAERKTASATITRPGARSTSKINGEELLARAQRTGEVPETDEGMAELIRARTARRLGKTN